MQSLHVCLLCKSMIHKTHLLVLCVQDKNWAEMSLKTEKKTQKYQKAQSDQRFRESPSPSAGSQMFNLSSWLLQTCRGGRLCPPLTDNYKSYLTSSILHILSPWKVISITPEDASEICAELKYVEVRLRPWGLSTPYTVLVNVTNEHNAYSLDVLCLSQTRHTPEPNSLWITVSGFFSCGKPLGCMFAMSLCKFELCF